MRIFLLLSLIGALALPVFTSAQLNLNLDYPVFGGIDLNCPDPQDPSCGQNLNTLIAWLYYFIIGIAGLAAFVMLVWGGIQWLTSGAIPSQMAEAKDKVRAAALGLLLILASFLIIQIINPQLTVLNQPGLQGLSAPGSVPAFSGETPEAGDIVSSAGGGGGGSQQPPATTPQCSDGLDNDNDGDIDLDDLECNGNPNGLSESGTTAPPGGGVSGGTDVFDIKAFHATAAGGTEWDSRHWANGRPRTLSNSNPWDPDDPMGISRHLGSSGYRIDGNGLLILDDRVASGEHPRFYIVPPHQGLPGWINTEITIYKRRMGNTSGILLGSHTLAGSHNPSGDHCQSNAYYGRLTSSEIYFCHEMVHASWGCRFSKSLSGAGLSAISGFPQGKWIGMKLITRNYDNNTKVLMEMYVDTTEGQNGGNWVKVHEVRHTGSNWPGERDTEWNTCLSRHPNRFPDGLNTVMTGVPAGRAGDGGAIMSRDAKGRDLQAKWMTVREIDPLP